MHEKALMDDLMAKILAVADAEGGARVTCDPRVARRALALHAGALPRALRRRGPRHARRGRRGRGDPRRRPDRPARAGRRARECRRRRRRGRRLESVEVALEPLQHDRRRRESVGVEIGQRAAQRGDETRALRVEGLPPGGGEGDADDAAVGRSSRRRSTSAGGRRACRASRSPSPGDRSAAAARPDAVRLPSRRSAPMSRNGRSRSRPRCRLSRLRRRRCAREHLLQGEPQLLERRRPRLDGCGDGAHAASSAASVAAWSLLGDVERGGLSRSARSRMTAGTIAASVSPSAHQ